MGVLRGAAGTPGSGSGCSPSETTPDRPGNGKLGSWRLCCGVGEGGGGELSQLGKLTATERHTLPPLLLQAPWLHARP